MCYWRELHIAGDGFYLGGGVVTRNRGVTGESHSLKICDASRKADDVFTGRVGFLQTKNFAENCILLKVRRRRHNAKSQG